MEIETRLALSYYQKICALNEEHEVFLVQHRSSRKIYVQKTLHIYNRSIYEYCKNNPIPNTPHIYEIHENEDKLIVIEEYISGDTLQELLDQKQTFSEKQVMDYTIQLCRILMSLHTSQPPIIHRDIKPSNIMLTPSGRIVLLDFNAAKNPDIHKNTDTHLLGTHGFAAPEQYGFGASSAQTDIYATGILMNTLLTGRISNQCLTEGCLKPVINRCIELSPKDRFSNVLELRKALEALKPAPPSHPNGYDQPQSWKRSFLPPGFRRKNPLYMILGTIMYVFIFWLGCTLTVENASANQLYIERSCFIVITLGIIFFSSNYRGVLDHIPLCKNQNKILKLTGIILLDIAFAFLILLVMAIIESIFVI